MTTFYIAPVGATATTSLDDKLGWTQLVDLGEVSLGFDGASDALVAVGRECYSASFKINRLTASRLLGIPYRHPRQILHNGKKPR